MSSQADIKFIDPHNGMQKNAVSTVSSFTAESGEFVLWYILGTEVHDANVLHQMAAKEAAAWDKEFAEFLFTISESDPLVDLYKRIEQTKQAARRAGRALVVVKNYELIESEAQKELIEDLICTCGDAITFVLISGQDVTVGVRAQSKLRRPGSPHYLLTKEDVRIYYTAIGIILGDDILDRILQITQGETVLVSRLGECLIRWNPLDNSDVDRAVENLSPIFMLEYYLPCQENLRQLQVLLSLLDDFTTELLCELTAFPIENVRKLLDDHDLIHHNVKDDIYHIQSLYRDFLRNQLPNLPKKLRYGFLRKAAQWHEDKGDYFRSVKYYAHCDDFEKIHSPLSKIAPLLVDSEISHSLIAILEKIPETEKCAQWELFHCLSLYNVLQYDEALRCLTILRDKLEAKHRTSDEDAVLGDTYMTFAFHAWLQGSPEYLTHITNACEHLDGPSKLFDDQYYKIVAGALRFRDMRPGDLLAMRNAFVQSIPYAKKAIPAMCCAVYLAIAEIHFCRMEFDDASFYLGIVISEAEAFHQWDILYEAYYLLQRVSMAAGDLDEVIGYSVQIHNHWHGNSLGYIQRVSQAQFQQYMGLFHMLEPWYGQKKLKAPAYLEQFDIGRGFFFHAVYLLLSQRQHYPAIYFIDQTMPICFESGLWFYGLKLIILKASIYSLLGKSALAVRFLEEAYHLSVPNGIIFPFVELGDLTGQLLKDTKEIPSAIDPLWIQTVQEKVTQYENTKKLMQEKYRRRHPEFTFRKLDALAGREFIALKHLCNGLSNEEIAQQMKVEGSSVYRYLSMAYKKVGAKGQNDAVRIAVLEGILDMSSE